MAGGDVFFRVSLRASVDSLRSTCFLGPRGANGGVFSFYLLSGEDHCAGERASGL